MARGTDRVRRALTSGMQETEPRSDQSVGYPFFDHQTSPKSAQISSSSTRLMSPFPG